jgi:2-polyprenyl-6-methoxyphenol hydroxylase-like FAD-dependent oxidoreductase
MSQKNTDFLIIGAGPTGLTLALELAAQPSPPSIRIIEATSVRSDKSRAFVLHPRTLELLSRHGITEKFTSKGMYNTAVRFYSKRAFVYELGLGEGVIARDTRWSNSLMISQAETESVLEEAIERLGIVVEQGVRAESVAQDSDSVTCLLKIEGEGGEEREEEVRCKYVIGCDGAHSIVRKSTGMKFEGGVYPQDFILADVHMKWEQKDCLSMFLGNGFMGVFPLSNNIFRLIVSRASEKGKEDEPTLQDFQDVVDEFVPGKTELSDPVWIARFRLHHRIVDCYRKGRCFVAGDAAHIHSPAGGQGMNTGMQDAINLGWKLASVLRGQSSDALLDTYDVERRKVGLKLLHGTDRMFELMSTTNPLFLYLRNTLVGWVVPWVMGDLTGTQKRFRFISQLGIRYRESSIVGQASSWKGGLRGGDRAPDGELNGEGGKKWLLELCCGVGFHLLLFSGTGDSALDDEKLEEFGSEFCKTGNNSVKFHKILTTPTTDGNGNIDEEGKVHELYGFKEPGYVLVRPDGYISFIGLLNSKAELDIWVKK